VPEEIDILKFVCMKLNQAELPYMLTGSLAANFYAVPRMTRDIDLVIELLESDVDRFFEVFQHDFYVSKESIADSIRRGGMFNAIHQGSAMKIDFIVRKGSPYRLLEFQRRRQVELDGTQVWIVSPEDLIVSKLFWAKDSLSEMQLRDVRNLRNSMRDLDDEYIRKHLDALGIGSLYEKAMTDG
jgi:predicted nucleotidyltransferase